ncbi:MAG: MFS transporter, partial [Betaproteobacteria bacterium]|nr:MFS transporter [Betaproteobacteria bacterium]
MSSNAAQRSRDAMVALTATLAIQMFTSLAATAPAVLAPALAQDLGITGTWIGVFVGLIYAGAMVSSLASGGFITRYGAIRVSQVCVLLCAIGIALVALLPATAVGLLAGSALLLGLGYGPITPASSQVLARTTPPARMSLVFSIKQTGVPAGTALAGAVLPGFALIAGWRGALLFVAVLGLVVAAVAQAPRASLDSDRSPATQFNVAALLAPLRTVARSRPLRELAFLAFAYASVQVCLTSFLVLYLHEVLNWSLIKAGLALTAATLGGVVGRIFWGAVADRGVPPRQVLTIIGLIAGVCGSVLALASPAWEIWLLLSVVALFGATAIGWNGVQLAELAREAPIGTAGAITGAAGFVTFAGVVVGPPLFALLAGITA